MCVAKTANKQWKCVHCATGPRAVEARVLFTWLFTCARGMQDRGTLDLGMKAPVYTCLMALFLALSYM